MQKKKEKVDSQLEEESILVEKAKEKDPNHHPLHQKTKTERKKKKETKMQKEKEREVLVLV